MASEYLRWKYRDVQPRETFTLTKAEKRRNWWHYHKWWLAFAALLLLGAGFLIRDIFFRPVPDYQVGYIRKTPAAGQALSALQARLEALGEDTNGDGRVVVELYTYALGFDAVSFLDVEATSSGITRLTVDLSSGRVYCLLLDDPEGFQQRMGALCYLDGSLPPAGAEDWEEMTIPAAACPALAELEGMDGLYLARRAVRDEEQRAAFAADERLFQLLTQ